MSDVLILGGGIVGLLSALELTQRGRKVTIVDGGSPPASWAGGGILSPLHAWRCSRFLNQLTVDGVARYRRLVDVLECGGYTQVGGLLNQGGMWVQGLEDELDDASRWATSWGVEHAFMSSADIPGKLVRKDLQGIFFPGLGNVRNPGLLKALRAYLCDRGVVMEHANVSAVSSVEKGAHVAAVDGRQWRADQAVICAGFGTAGLLEKMGVSLPLFPAKGEMLLYQLSPGDVSAVMLTDEGYLIPRNDGAVLVGSTLRKGDASHYPTVAGRYALERLAQQLMPGLVETKPCYHWAGVRPGCDRDYPYLGPLPHANGIYVATGHYRNGLVAAPASAELLVQGMCGESPFVDPSPYSVPSSSRSSSSFLRR